MIDEFERLNAVDRFKKLDAGIKKDLDDIVNLLASICNVPVALISLIDDKMQWFKASVGTGEINCNARELSFCQHTILHDEVLIVKDASQDSRFANLPIVSNAPYVKFYAGVPLMTYDGHAVGSLCVLHVQPIELSELQINTIKVLSKQVTNLIELNWSMQSLMEQNQSTQLQKKRIEDSEIKLKAVFDSQKDIHILIGRNMEVLAYNKAAYKYIKANYQKEIRQGVHFLTLTNQNYTDEMFENIHAAMKGKVVNSEWLLQYEQEDARWLEVTFEPVTDNTGLIIGVTINATDVTIRKQNAEQIDKQNEALQKIATIQSHELRKPVASLMGLMEVLKLDDNYVFNSYYPMIELTINELDTKIKDIVYQSERTLNHPHN
ncbi:GAF domain-containing protein [Mucilaginibacter sp. PAMB04274]|uniref:GAF domain-containing protein n=1 Tax=Mucilaginibacter sp. PAMB04274 TaxID=3138568 RepID=UPI0031F622AD